MARSALIPRNRCSTGWGWRHRFQWYMYNNTLYISTLDQQESARLEVSSETIADLKQALTDIGLLDSRFNWGAIPEDGVVFVSGPESLYRANQTVQQSASFAG